VASIAKVPAGKKWTPKKGGAAGWGPKKVDSVQLPNRKVASLVYGRYNELVNEINYKLT
jgi:hypothetical protein